MGTVRLGLGVRDKSLQADVMHAQVLRGRSDKWPGGRSTDSEGSTRANGSQAGMTRSEQLQVHWLQRRILEGDSSDYCSGPSERQGDPGLGGDTGLQRMDWCERH